MKKLLIAVIALLLCIFIIACDNDKDNEEKEKINEEYEDADNNDDTLDGEEGKNNEGESNGNEENGSEIVDLAEVYSLYPGLERIGTFNNGLAPFVVRDDEGQKYGYIDINGEVIVEPNYITNYYVYNQSNIYDIPTFEEYNYVSVSLSSTNTISKILDKSGNVVFEVEKDGVSELSKISNGYFAVETKKEEFTGYVYTVTYYSAKDGKKIAEFPNASIFYDRWSYDSTDIKEDGSASVLSDGKAIWFNISSYDPDFKAKVDSWSVDVNQIEAFQGVTCYWLVSSETNTLGQIATVVLKNKDDIYYYATVDQNGNVLMAPQKNISFRHSNSDYSVSANCVFYNDLCPAKDEATGLWGYINPQGEWMIQPQYTDALPFGTDGYTTVDYTTVIDTKGNNVLEPLTINATDLIGTYAKGTGDEVAFFEDGRVRYSYYGGYEPCHFWGDYTIQSGKLVISNMKSISWLDGLDPNRGSDQNGEHAIQKDGDDLIINGERWTKSK